MDEQERAQRAADVEARALPPVRIWRELLLVAVGLTELALMTTEGQRELPLWEVAARLGLLAALVLLRHRWWRWVLPLVLVGNVFAFSATVLIASVYSWADRCQRRWPVIVFVVLATLAYSVPEWQELEPPRALVWTMMILAVFGVVSTLGAYSARSRRLMVQLRRRAQEAEANRTSAQEEARRAERTRIAREMHDIVAHKISLVALQAGALEVNQNLDREHVTAAAGLIRATAAEALSELREVLGVLRSEGEEAPLMPQPTWTDVRALVDASKEAGVNVELFDFIDDAVPDQLARTAYRMVQEGLTNIHKHARHTKARVTLIGEPGNDLVIEVSNVLPQGFTTDLPGAGMGLSGIETRVLHSGGTITSGPTDDGRFEVKAVIPWPTT